MFAVARPPISIVSEVKQTTWNVSPQRGGFLRS
jgi:hypothetical protein